MHSFSLPVSDKAFRPRYHDFKYSEDIIRIFINEGPFGLLPVPLHILYRDKRLNIFIYLEYLSASRQEFFVIDGPNLTPVGTMEDELKALLALSTIYIVVMDGGFQNGLLMLGSAIL